MQLPILLYTDEMWRAVVERRSAAVYRNSGVAR